MVAIMTSANDIALPQLISHSIYYRIRDELDLKGLDSTFVSVRQSYPITGSIIAAPSVVITEGDFTDAPFELGGMDIADVDYVIDIYGRDTTQMNTLSWLVRDVLNDEYIDVKDYNEGFPPTSVTTLGQLEVIDVQITAPIIQTEGEIPEAIRYFVQVIVSAQYFIN